MTASQYVGTKFGRLTVESNTPDSDDKLNCRCECGKTLKVFRPNLLKRHTQSCGCLMRERSSAAHRTHGWTRTTEYAAWAAAKTRCTNQKLPTWRYYGGRGIRMCERWAQDFAAFIADMGPRPPGYSLDRIDPNGHYEPSNCRWASKLTQANNCRNNRVLELDGQSHTVAEWERLLGFKSGTLKRRVLKGWDTRRALTEPVRQQ